MLVEARDGLDIAPDYPELVGRRVLLTGVAPDCGADVARLLAGHRTRLVVHSQTEGHEITGLGAVLAKSALDLRMLSGALDGPEAVLAMARAAVRCFGGIDAVINIAPIGRTLVPADATEGEVERFLAAWLATPCLVTRVAANTMRATLTRGLVLNVMVLDRFATARDRAVAALARSALAAFTRSEATAAARDGIRINAIAPQTLGQTLPPAIGCTPDVASLVLHLMGRPGISLSGLVFEAAGA